MWYFCLVKSTESTQNLSSSKVWWNNKAITHKKVTRPLIFNFLVVFFFFAVRVDMFWSCMIKLLNQTLSSHLGSFLLWFWGTQIQIPFIMNINCRIICHPGHHWHVHLHLCKLIAHPEGLDCVKGGWKVNIQDFDHAARLIQQGKGPLEKQDDCIICFTVCLVGKLQGVYSVSLH